MDELTILRKMKPLRLSLFCSVAAVLGTGCAYVHRVPPGQSIAFAMAKKPELVSLPPEAQPTPAPAAAAPRQAAANLPPEELALPTLSPSDTEKAADSFALGNFCLAQGRNEEAIAAYEATVKLNPNFPDAWSKLAIAYQNAGEDKKAAEAFKKYRTVSVK